MPHCYLLVLSKSSSLDRQTNSWSLFTLVEQIQLGGLTKDEVVDGAPVLPYEVHAHWEFAEEELGTPFECQINTSIGNDTLASQVMPISSETRQHRLRIRGLGIPGVGRGYVRVRAREVGEDEWQEQAVVWPLEVHLQADEQGELQLQNEDQPSVPSN